LLKVENLQTGYGDVQILFDASLEVNAGEIVALIGANGAGKTTMLRTISGLIPAWKGKVYFENQEIQNAPSHKIVAKGLIQVAEGRKLFPKLSVLENLELGSFIRSARRNRPQNLKKVFELFPRLAER